MLATRQGQMQKNSFSFNALPNTTNDFRGMNPELYDKSKIK